MTDSQRIAELKALRDELAAALTAMLAIPDFDGTTATSKRRLETKHAARAALYNARMDASYD